MQKVILITFFYFLLGFIGIVYITKKNKALRSSLWTKYLVYLVIVCFMLSTVYFDFHIKFVAMFISSICLLEALYVWFLSLKKKYITLAFSLSILLFYLFGFYQFYQTETTSVILFIYTLVFSIDGFSQVSGQIFGKRHIFATISPNKTLEGMIGGFIMAFITAFLINDLIVLSTLSLILTTLIIYFASLTGDLLASYYKRICYIKDYSNLIPGHGGFLDRFDSYISAGAIYFFLNEII